MMTCQPFAKPALRPERHLLAPSLWQSTLAIGYALLLFAGPLALALFVAASEWFGWWALAALPLLLPAGYGLFLQGILGHEGFHFNLSSNRLLSCLLAVVTSSLLFGFCVTGYFVDHWQHHRYSNSPRDPDWRVLRRYRGAFSRLLVSRLHTTFRYLLKTLWLAMPGSTIDGCLPLPAWQIRLLARANLVCLLL